MMIQDFLSALTATIFAALISFTLTPAVRVFAFRIGAVDVPKDDRRMHDHPIPRMGGLAIFLAFGFATLIFCDVTPTMCAIWFGGILIVLAGILDDIYTLHPLAKFLVQVLVALIAVWQGLTVEFVSLFGHYITFGVFSIPITMLWIIGLTNAINLIDGLDGLSCGVSAICSTTLLIIMILKGDYAGAAITAALVGSCLGFLPFNSNPARIFMGDTGSMFLGYVLSLLSISGLFKFHTIVSFLIPLSIFGLPLFDTMFAFFRRIVRKQNPFKPDQGHIHHRLIRAGFNQKQSVRILYAVCGILGVASVMLSMGAYWKAAVVVAIGISILVIYYFLLKNETSRQNMDVGLPPMEAQKDGQTNDKP